MFQSRNYIFTVSTQSLIAGLRDNFRIEWKKIPRDEHDQLIIAAEKFSGSKWQYYNKLTFLADHMRTRNQLALGSNENVKFETIPGDSQPYYEANSTEIPDDENGFEIEDDNDEPQLIEIPEYPVCNFPPKPQLQKIRISKHNYTSPCSSTSYTKQHKSPSKKRKFEECETSENDNGIIMDDNYHFLMSLQPYMNLAIGPQKLKLRIKIQKLLFKELFKDDYEEEK